MEPSHPDGYVARLRISECDIVGSSNSLPVAHSVMQDDEYQGYFIPAGSTIVANIWYAKFFHLPCTYVQHVNRFTSKIGQASTTSPYILSHRYSGQNATCLLKMHQTVHRLRSVLVEGKETVHVN